MTSQLQCKPPTRKKARLVPHEDTSNFYLERNASTTKDLRDSYYSTCYPGVDIEDFGKLKFIDAEETGENAQGTCSSLKANLVPLRAIDVLLRLDEFVADCLDGKNVMMRTYNLWHIGLRFEDGVGKWSDGVTYDATRDGRLFVKPPNQSAELPCLDAFYMARSHGLISLNCSTEAKTICFIPNKQSFTNMMFFIKQWSPMGIACIAMLILAKLLVDLFQNKGKLERLQKTSEENLAALQEIKAEDLNLDEHSESDNNESKN